MNPLDLMAKELGFENANEMLRLVASVKISTSEKLKRFEDWKKNDGTKTGLLKVKKLND